MKATSQPNSRVHSAPPHQNLAANPAAALFKRRFGHPPALLVRAPGTLTLLGSLAPAADGLSFTVAVDRHVSLAATPRTDGRIELIHPLALAGHSFWLSNLADDPNCEWASPVKAVLMALQQRGVHFTGFSAAIHDAIPTGLGSPAALKVATTLLVRQMFPFALTDSGLGSPPKRDPRTQQLPELSDAERRHLAKLCRAAGTPSAAVLPCTDPFTPLFARAWQALVIDWQSGAVERWPFAGTAVVFCDVGKFPQGQRAIGEARESLSAAASKLGVRSLRSVEPAFLKANQARLNPLEAAAVSQVVAETHWIVRCESALRDGDHRQLGQFLWLSHESARDGLQAVPPEAEVLVKAARAHRSCLGARALFEEGRIATASLVNYHEVEGFVAHLAAEGARQLGRPVQPLVLPVVDGAG